MIKTGYINDRFKLKSSSYNVPNIIKCRLKKFFLFDMYN